MPFLPKDIHCVGEILAFAARTEIMPRFRRLTATQVREKSSQYDLVTDADEKAEAVIACRLKAAFPDAIVIGEEGAHRGPRCCKRSPPPNWPSLSIRSTGPGTSPPTCLYSV
jgi:fructose-1,6-bisphosphatase/inositol monophosphatase family enzyme